MRDILLEKNEDGIYDISIENGDFKGTDGLDTSIIISLLTDKRAESSEVSDSRLRRGWIGNEQNDDSNYEVGSKLWLLYQSRLNEPTKNNAASFCSESLMWLVDDNLVKDIDVSSEISDNSLFVDVIFTRFNNTVDSKRFDLWENTSIA